MKEFVAFDGTVHPVSDDCDLGDPTTQFNLNATVSRLRERPDRDIHETYGETVPIDVLKFTDWISDCGCHLRYVWRRDHDHPERKHIPHLAIRQCDLHSDLEHDEHYHAVVAHNEKLNQERKDTQQ